jgi:hypothetical protein
MSKNQWVAVGLIVSAVLVVGALSHGHFRHRERIYYPWWDVMHQHPQHEPWRAEPLAAIDEPTKPPATFTPQFGAITAIDEIVKVKAMVAELGKRPPTSCVCQCGKQPVWQRPPVVPVVPGSPEMQWRVDPFNPGVLQWGYLQGGMFWVITTTPKATPLPP